MKTRNDVEDTVSRGLFNSIGCSYDDLFSTMGFEASLTSVEEDERSQTTQERSGDSNLFSLTSGLKPLKDSYLISSQSNLNAPIFQMFPELEGYTGLIFVNLLFFLSHSFIF